MVSLLTRRSLIAAPLAASMAAPARDWDVEITQLTHGPKHHYFGYIGHVRNTPWNGSDRYMALLRMGFQDHMPAPAEAAEVVLVDTRNNNEIAPIDQSRAWNPQQGTMFYWYPKAADTQLIFNDRDLKTNRVFAVLYDIAKRKRVREYHYDDTPFGNSGVAQKGGYFLGLNYGRMARLRPVTGYPGSYDWNAQTPAPDNDGIFLVEIDSGKKRLLVSFRQLAELIAPKRPDTAGIPLFINHTLWNRDDNRIYFYVRGNFEKKGSIDVPCTIHPDGSGLTMQKFMGGHPEWEFGGRLIGDSGGKQVIYDVDKQEIVDQIGTPEILPSLGVIARSPTMVNGSSTDTVTGTRMCTCSFGAATVRISERVLFPWTTGPAATCVAILPRAGIGRMTRLPCLRSPMTRSARGRRSCCGSERGEK